MPGPVFFSDLKERGPLPHALPKDQLPASSQFLACPSPSPGKDPVREHMVATKVEAGRGAHGARGTAWGSHTTATRTESVAVTWLGTQTLGRQPTKVGPGTATEGRGSTVHGPCCRQCPQPHMEAGKGRIASVNAYMICFLPLLILSLLSLHSLLAVFP